MRKVTFSHPKDGDVRIPLVDLKRAVEQAQADMTPKDRKIVSAKISKESFKRIAEEMSITTDQALITWQTFKTKFFRKLRDNYSEKRVNTWAGLWEE